MMVFSMTDLPVPEGPSITEISPAGSVRVTSFQMSWLPNDLVRPTTPTSVPTSDHPPARSRTTQSVTRDTNCNGPNSEKLLNSHLRLRLPLRSLHDPNALVWRLSRRSKTRRKRCPIGTQALGKSLPDARSPPPTGGGLRGGGAGYLTLTEAPAASRASFAFSAVSLLTFSRTGFGAASTRSL